MTILKWLPIAGALVSLFFGGSARAEETPEHGTDAIEENRRFGTPSVIALSSSLAIDFGGLSRADSESSSFSINASPAADLFVVRNLSIGGSLLFGYRTSSDLYDVPGSGFDPNVPQKMLSESTSFTYGLSARLAYNAWLSDSFSLWPRLAIGVWTLSGKHTTLPDSYFSYRDGIMLPRGDYRETALWVGAYLPLLFHPAQHFFVGFGPEVFFDVLHDVEETKNRRRYWGATSVVGGWF